MDNSFLFNVILHRILLVIGGVALAVWWFQLCKDKSMHYVWKVIFGKIGVIFTIVFPCYMLVLPIMDYFDGNKYNYQATIQIDGLTKPSNRRIDLLNEYSIGGSGKNFKVVKSVYPFKRVQKGRTYKVKYFKYSKVVYYMELLPE